MDIAIALLILGVLWILLTGTQMVDATADADSKWRSNNGRNSFQIADAVTLFRDQLVQLQSGFANHWDETGKFLGIATEGDERTSTSGILGETSDDSPPEVHIIEGAILTRLTVGGTPTQAKVGDLVYCADSDIANMTLTDTTNPPVGTLWRFRTTTDHDVKLFTHGEFEAGIASGTWLV